MNTEKQPSNDEVKTAENPSEVQKTKSQTKLESSKIETDLSKPLKESSKKEPPADPVLKSETETKSAKVKVESESAKSTKSKDKTLESQTTEKIKSKSVSENTATKSAETRGADEKPTDQKTSQKATSDTPAASTKTTAKVKIQKGAVKDSQKIHQTDKASPSPPPISIKKPDPNQKIISGRRKTSVSRIRILRGTGKIIVNKRDGLEYFKRKILINKILKPFDVAKMRNQFNVIAKCNGGGLSGQAGSLRLAIAKTLNELYPHTRGALKKAGFLTRDARKVERKIYGHKKARKSFQFSKR